MLERVGETLPLEGRVDNDVLPEDCELKERQLDLKVSLVTLPRTKSRGEQPRIELLVVLRLEEVERWDEQMWGSLIA